MEAQKIDNETMDKAWRYHKNADALLAGRINYGLVAQSMLIVAYATLFAPSEHAWNQLAAIVVICFLGFFFSWFQWQTAKSIKGRLSVMVSEYLGHEPVYKKYKEAPPRKGERHTNDRNAARYGDLLGSDAFSSCA